MTRYSFLEEFKLNPKYGLVAAGGAGLGALAGNIISRKTYKAPADEKLIDDNHDQMYLIRDKMKSIQSEIAQLMTFRDRLEKGDYSIDYPIEAINAKLEKKQKSLNILKSKLSALRYQTTQDLRDNDRRKYIKKGTLTGLAAGSLAGTGANLFL